MSFLKNIFSSKKDNLSNNQQFWDWFVQNEKTFYNAIKSSDNIQGGFVNKFSPKLSELNESFHFLAGMLDENTAEIIFTADGKIQTLVFIEELVESAPNIPAWKFTAHKQSMDTSRYSVDMGGIKFGNETISFYSNENPAYPDEIDITIVHPDYNERQKDTFYNGVYIFLDNHLGELNSVSMIDKVTVIGPSQAAKELIPVEKLHSFLTWREKEFVEKHKSVWRESDKNNYSILEAQQENGNALIAVINTDLLNWDAKASHPWMMIVVLKYDGSRNNGMPDEKTYQALGDIEEEILTQLKDSEGYLNIGRQTCEGEREIFFACKEFRKPSKVLDTIAKKYPQYETSFEIFKDKYWMSMEHFNQD
ncbi:MAG: hypothetical protein K0S32_3556 [Bacteroidetes bacterium]|nr:hypothetical protein [Bacteroidota bacterium]